MKRVLVGFCLALILILLDGYDQLYARTPMQGYLATVQTDLRPLVSISMPTESAGHSLETAIEEEDNQSNTFKKYLQTRCQFGVIFLVETFTDLFHDNVQGVAFFGPPPYTQASSQTLLQVFRI